MISIIAGGDGIMKQFKIWVEEHRDYFIDLLRIFMGMILILKGVQFVQNMELLHSFVDDVGPYSAVAFAHFIVFTHILGGVMLLFGLLTRLAAGVQVPILAGAVFLVHSPEGFFTETANLHFTLSLLVMLVVYTFYGSGRLSVDHWIAESKKRRSRFQERPTSMDQERHNHI